MNAPQHGTGHSALPRIAATFAAAAVVGLTAGTLGASVASAATYKDGTYSATGTYARPGGTENLGVTVTLKNSVVQSVTVTPKGSNPVTNGFQDRVKNAIGSQALGKPLDSVHATKTSGSSLTPNGFNDAISKIKQQAKA